jgi:hypothetical protein
MRILLTVTILISATAGLAAAAASPSDICRTGKQAAAAKYVACRAKADRKLDVGGSTSARDAALQACGEKLSTAWATLEAKATARGDSCPTVDDEALIENLAEVHSHRVNLEVSGQPRFVDNGDGTISDRRTGLMWEKKNNSPEFNQFFSNPHGAAVGLRWAAGCGDPDGCQVEQEAAATCTSGAVGAPLACDMCSIICEVDPNVAGAYTAWGYLNRINAEAFAGHDDWRIPTLDELRTLLDLSNSGHAVDPAFNTAACAADCTDETDEACSCNLPGTYLTSSAAATSTPSYTRVWMVSFGSGAITTETAGSYARARLVRGTCLSVGSEGCH